MLSDSAPGARPGTRAGRIGKANLSMKVLDCSGRRARSRPWRAGPAIRTERRTRGRFYPTLDGRLYRARLHRRAFGASCGVAVDLTVVPKSSQQPAFDPNAHYGSCAGPVAAPPTDDSLDIGHGYDYFDAKSWTRAAGPPRPINAARAESAGGGPPHGFKSTTSVSGCSVTLRIRPPTPQQESALPVR